MAQGVLDAKKIEICPSAPKRYGVHFTFDPNVDIIF